MRICIISAVNVKHMSMATFYSEFFSAKGIEFDLIYFDKYNIDETLGETKKYVYKKEFTPKTSKLTKIIEYYKFKKYAKQILLREEYDFVVVWNDLAIHLFGSFLSENYKGNYCLNIRDYFAQDIKIVSKSTRKAINNSAFNTISSEGYKYFLPRNEYFVMHSINNNVKQNTLVKKNEFPIRLTFVGNVRFFDQNKYLLEIFKNSMDFKLQYFGTNANHLRKYCESNYIYNTKFHDSFSLEETSKFVEDGDLVNNLYGNSSKTLDYSVSIKLYHSVIARQPIIVMDNTFIGELVDKYKIGLVVDSIDKNLPQKIKNFYEDFDITEYNNACENFIEEAKNENNIILKHLDMILDEKLGNKGVVL